MKNFFRKISLIVIVGVVIGMFPIDVHAESEEYLKGYITDIVREEVQEQSGYKVAIQVVKVKLETGQEIQINYGDNMTLSESQKVNLGQSVVISKLQTPNGERYQIIDTYRLPWTAAAIGAFFLLVILLSRLKGVGAISGMIISIGIIVLYIVPQILSGQDPLLVGILGSIFIMLSTMYIAHGFSSKTTIALISTGLCLVVTGILSVVAVDVTRLTGLGSDDAVSLLLGPTQNLNYKGLLLTGIIIGALGVLDDITTSLTASIFEIQKTNPNISFSKLVYSALEIGKEHIASLVNTLVLAYAGASLPIFLIIILNPNNTPLWVILNSELLIEEVIRTVIGSMGLVIAVPITTYLASWYVVSTHLTIVPGKSRIKTRKV